ncbi:MAG: hypothetical protein Greene041679_658, partial [Parcubacteria group bacterium Greene0416_79]
MTRDTNSFKKKLLAEKDGVEQELATVGRRNPANPADWEPLPAERDVVPADRDE